MQTAQFYETTKAVSEYLLFHYAEASVFEAFGFTPNAALDFAARCGKLHADLPIRRSRALDLGCAVGRSSFELSRQFDEVIGIDFAHALIDTANALKANATMSATYCLEGDVVAECPIALPKGANPERVSFEQGDAMNLPASLGQFDFILMANLIDRLPDPRICLESISKYVAPGGAIAITSPYTWLEAYTPKEKWLGGFEKNGNPVRTIDTLHEILTKEFALERRENMPFLIREHARKNQFSIAEATIWRKR